jgi:5-methylcytosine-specific restriction endonuclease McrBC regulatory subunit McrC
VQYSHLTDDELWRAVVKNTDAISVLFDQQREAGIRGLPDVERSAMLSISRAIDRLEREYQDYASELRRRCSLILNSKTPSSVGSNQAA